jgi:hypothetical protein
VPEVPAALRAVHLDARHAVRLVDLRLDAPAPGAVKLGSRA